MDLEKYLSADFQVPFEDAAAFSVELRRQAPVEYAPPQLTKEAKKGIIKLLLAKHAQGEDAEALQDAVMLDPEVQRALDFQEAQAQAANLSQQVMAQQQQLEQMQQGMQQLQQQAEQAGQQAQMATQENQNLQSQLQGEMQMRQQANMQAMQAQDQAISTQAAAQQQRMQLTQLADQMSLQLKQVASQDPVQAQQQQQMAQEQQAQAEQEQAMAQMPAKQRKEMEEAQKAQQNAEVQGQQAAQAQQQMEAQAPMEAAGPMQAAMQQQAAAAQPPQPPAPEGGMVAQSAEGMGKVDYLKHKLKEAALNVDRLRGAYGAGRFMQGIKGKGRLGKWFGAHDTKALKDVGMSAPERLAYRAGEHRDKLLAGGAAVGGLGLGLGVSALNKEKNKEAAINPRLLVGATDTLGGAALGGLGGALTAGEGERGKAALRGAALGTLVGGAGGAAHAATMTPARAKAISELTSAGGRRAIKRVHAGKLIRPRYERAMRDFAAQTDPIETAGEMASGTAGLTSVGLGIREGRKTKESSELRNARQGRVDEVVDYGKEKDAILGKCSGCGCKVKKSEMAKHTCGMKLASVPGATTPLKARLIEAGLGAGLGAAVGLGYEAARQRFSRGVDVPTPAEIDLARRNRAAEIKVKESPTLINRLAATKAQAQLDAERDLRMNPKKALFRRAVQGAIVGTAAAPSIMAAKRNLGPRIMGR